MKYVALSDLHLGQNGRDGNGFCSLLSKLNSKKVSTNAKFLSAEKKEKLNQNIKDFVNGDEFCLVLCGDILDLSMSTMKEGMADLKRIIDRLRPLSVFYVVGNHDHHIWNLHSEYIRAIKPMLEGQLPSRGSMYQTAGDEGELNPFLSSVLGTNVFVSYPYLKIPFASSNIILTHGHLMGGLYTLISRILHEQLESFPMSSVSATVNLPIIEFIYWLIGQMGYGMGVNGLSESLYYDLKKGKNSLLKQVIKEAIDVLLKDGVLSWMPNSWERSIAKKMAYKYAENLAKSEKTKPITSQDRHRKTDKTRYQFRQWINEGFFNFNESVRFFVFGHTHMIDAFYINPTDHSPASPYVFNLGGWLVEPERPIPDSSILLIDSIRMKVEHCKI